jgi:hypothetical protein
LRLFEGAFEEEDVVVVVFGHQNGVGGNHCRCHSIHAKGELAQTNFCVRTGEGAGGKMPRVGKELGLAVKSALQGEESK